ncbi:hypothetical protein AYI68_g3717 [Smittium mucronatum]|uniref:Uncharacterized protein n=1 Tax=Smittium mucronatum TaxID=133383 RepID=A0A1R0GZA2_9FUNG|nr:hypothetical protein AYI68_g3717 [Smittium mucronatum]
MASEKEKPELKVGDPLTAEIIARIKRVEKNDKKLVDLARAYNNVNQARKEIEVVLKAETPIEKISDIEGLTDHFKNTKLKLQMSQTEINRMSQELLEYKARIQGMTSLRNENNSLKNDLEDIKSKLDARDLELNETKKSLALKKSENEVLTTDLGKFQNISEELETLKKEFSQSSVKIETLSNSLSVAEITINNQNEELTRSMSEKESLISDLKKFKEDLNHLKSENSDLLDKNSTLDSELKKLNSVDSELEELKKLNQELQDKISESSLVNNTESIPQESSITNSETALDFKSCAQNLISSFDIEPLGGMTDPETLDLVSQAMKKLSIIYPKSQESHSPIHSSDSILTKDQIIEVVTNCIDGKYNSLSDQNRLATKKKQNKNKNKKSSTSTENIQSKPPAIASGASLEQIRNISKVLETYLKKSLPESETDVDSATESSSSIITNNLHLKSLEDSLKKSLAEEENLKKINHDICKELDENSIRDKKLIDDLNSKLNENIEAIKKNQLEIEKLKSINFDSNNKADLLSQNVSDLQSKIKAIDEENLALKNDLETNISEKNSLKESLTKKIDDLSLEKTILENSSKKIAQEKDGLVKKLDDSSKLIDILKKNISDLELQISSLKSDNEKLSKQQIVFARASKESTIKNIELEKSLQEKTKLVQASSTRLNDTNKEFESLKINFNRLSSENKNLNQANLKMSNEVTNLKSEVLSKNKLLTESSDKNEKLNAMVSQQNSKVKELVEKIDSLNNTIATLEGKIPALQQDLIQSRNLFSEKSAMCSELQSKIANLEFINDKNSKKYEQDKSSYEAELASLTRELNEIQDQKALEITKLKESISKLTSESHSKVELSKPLYSESEWISMNKKCDEQLIEIQSLKSNLEKLDEKLNSLTNENIELKASSTSVSELKLQLEAKNEESKLANIRWKRIHHALKDEIRRLQRESNSDSASFITESLPGSTPITGSNSFKNVPVMSRAETKNSGLRTSSLTSSVYGGSFSLNNSNSNTSKNNIVLESSSHELLKKSSLGIGVKDISHPESTSHPKIESTGLKKEKGSISPYFGDPSHIPNTPQPISGTSSSINAIQRKKESNSNAKSHSPSPSDSSAKSFSEKSSDPNYINVDYLRNVLFKFFNDKDRRVSFCYIFQSLILSFILIFILIFRTKWCQFYLYFLNALPRISN